MSEVGFLANTIEVPELPDVIHAAKLEQCITDGYVQGATYEAAQLLGVAELKARDLPEGTSMLRASLSDNAYSQMVSAVSGYGQNLDFVREEGTLFAQYQNTPTWTEDKLYEWSIDPLNPACMQREASGALSEFRHDISRYQAEVAASRVGWARIAPAGHYVACTPDGDVVYGKGRDARQLNEYLKQNGYRRMPSDDPHAEPLLRRLAAMADMTYEELTARDRRSEETTASEPVAAGDSENTASTRIFPEVDATRVDVLQAWHPDDQAETAVFARTAFSEDLIAGPSTFEIALVIARTLGSGLRPETASASARTIECIRNGATREQLPDYTETEQQAVVRALNAALAGNPDAATYLQIHDALDMLGHPASR